MARRQLSFTVVSLMLIGLGSIAHAQAWVGEKGSLDATLDYNLGISDKVVGTGNQDPCAVPNCFPNAGSTTHQFTLRAEYTIIEHLAAQVDLPFVLLKYTGTPGLYPHPGGGTYDDGNYHNTLTDLLIKARYQVLADPFALAPHLGVSIPLADYETVGNTVAGRHLKALHLGLAAGKIIADTFYVHALYDFTWAEKYDRTPETAKYNQNASDLVFTVGDKLLDGKLDINLDANYHHQHGGINFVDFGTLGFTSPQVTYHDPILKETMFLLGGGVGYQITPAFDVAFAARIFVSGENTQNANVFGLSMTYSVL